MFLCYILIFWISIIGYSLYIKYRFNIKSELLLSLVFSSISVIVFFSGLLNILKLTSIVLLIFGIVLGIRVFIKNKKEIINSVKKPNINMILVAILLLYVTIVYKDLHFLHYDNFSHWGVIAKNLLLNNSFPNFETTVIEFKAYQPGTACFIYYFANFLELKEGYMILAQNYLFIGFISSLFVLVKGKYKNIFRILIFTSIIFISVVNILPYDLLVDTILTSILISIFAYLFVYKDNIKKLFYMILPITIFLTLVKNSGILLVFITCCLFLYNSIINKEYKKGLKYTILIGIASLFIFYIWSSHVKFAYGSSALESHHAMTVNNILPHVKSLGIEKIIQFIKVYIKNFININNISNIVILTLNVLLFSFIPTFKSKKHTKSILKFILVIDLIYLFYYLMLGAMYIFSMEESSLFQIPCFNRYMYTIVFSLFGLFLLYFLKIYKDFNNRIIVCFYSIILIIGMIVFVILGYCDNFEINKHHELFIGKNTYDKSYSKIFDEYLGENYANTNNHTLYYIYLSESEMNKDGYISHMAKYKLNHDNIKVVYNLTDIKNVDDNTIIVVLDKNNYLKEFMDNNYICKISKGLYKKCND